MEKKLQGSNSPHWCEEGAKWEAETRFKKDVFKQRPFKEIFSAPAASSRLRLFEVIPCHVMLFV